MSRSVQVVEERPETGAGWLRLARLDRFGGALRIRDPRGRSVSPSLRVSEREGAAALEIRGPFLLSQCYRVTRSQGERFCEATGDANPLHLEGDIVPGAYTAARLLVALEGLVAEYELARFSMKFTAPVRYGQRVCTQARLRPIEGALVLEGSCFADGSSVARMQARLEWIAGGARIPTVRRRRLDTARLRAVRRFFHAIDVEPRLWFGRRGVGGYTYPCGYLAALPSGEMVRRLEGGRGGLLNKLDLRFETAERLPILHERPRVSIEQPPRRASKAFQRIMAAISQSVRTYVSGSALVLRGEVAALSRPLHGARLLPGR